MIRELSSAIVELERDAIPDIVKTRLELGEESLQILEDCRLGMKQVGERFQAGEYYLAELMIAAELFKDAVALLKPHLGGVQSTGSTGKIVLATMRGDIHDLGKNLLVTLLGVQAFEVHDLGVNVEPKDLVEKVREVKPNFIGFSSLITTSFESTKQAIQQVEEAGLRNGGMKILLGGGVTSPEVKDYVGADFQTLDAATGVDYCLAIARGQ